MIPASWLPLAAGGELTQPSLHLLFHVCNVLLMMSHVLSGVNQPNVLGGNGCVFPRPVRLRPRGLGSRNLSPDINIKGKTLLSELTP